MGRSTSDDDVFDVAVVGAGGAGIACLHHLAETLAVSPRRAAPFRVLVCDAVNRLARPVRDRTWCYWAEEPSFADAAAARSWGKVSVGRAGVLRVLDVSPFRYVMVDAKRYYELVAERVAAMAGALEVHFVGAVDALRQDGMSVTVQSGEESWRARWALDSRPVRPSGVTTEVWQHFVGSEIEVSAPVFDVGVPRLMDFTKEQPERGVAFGYVLPTSARRALVEYTEFTPHCEPLDVRRERLRRYVGDVVGAAHASWGYEEAGEIPMFDAPPIPARGRIVPMGSWAGAVRPSTGYAFAALQRGAAHLVKQLLDGVPLTSPQWYSRRHRAMDGVMLGALASGGVVGSEFFLSLFSKNPAERVVRYLDGSSTERDDVALMATCSAVPMMSAAVVRTRAGSSTEVRL